MKKRRTPNVINFTGNYEPSLWLENKELDIERFKAVLRGDR